MNAANPINTKKRTGLNCLIMTRVNVGRRFPKHVGVGHSLKIFFPQMRSVVTLFP